MSSAENIIKTITEAGLDYHDFKVGIIAKRLAEYVEMGYEITPTFTWAEIAEFPSRNNAQAIAKAWELAGTPDPYAEDEDDDLVYDEETDEWVRAA